MVCWLSALSQVIVRTHAALVPDAVAASIGGMQHGLEQPHVIDVTPRTAPIDLCLAGKLCATVLPELLATWVAPTCCGSNVCQPQRIARDRHRTETHHQDSNQGRYQQSCRRIQYAGGNRHTQGVIEERDHQVLLHVAHDGGYSRRAGAMPRCSWRRWYRCPWRCPSVGAGHGRLTGPP